MFARLRGGGAMNSNQAKSAVTLANTKVLKNALRNYVNAYNGLAPDARTAQAIGAILNSRNNKNSPLRARLLSGIMKVVAASRRAGAATAGAVGGAVPETPVAPIVNNATSQVNKLKALIEGIKNENTVGAYMAMNRNINKNRAMIGNNAALRAFFADVNARRAAQSNVLKRANAIPNNASLNVIAATVKNLENALTRTRNTNNIAQIQKRINQLSRRGVLQAKPAASNANIAKLGNKVWNRAWGGYGGMAVNYNFPKIAREIRATNVNYSRIANIANKKLLKNYLSSNSRFSNVKQKARAYSIINQL